MTTEVEKIIRGLEISLAQQRRACTFYCARCVPDDSRQRARVVLHGQALCVEHARVELEGDDASAHCG